MAAPNCVATGRCTTLSQGLDYDDHNVLHPDNHGVYHSISQQAGEVSHPIKTFDIWFKIFLTYMFKALKNKASY